MRRPILILAVISLLLVACGGDGNSAGSLPQGAEPVELNPDDFVQQIDNPYWPMAPGSKWVLTQTDLEGNKERIEITVTNRKKTIQGIEATVVRDVVSQDGELVEVTSDWFAQDKDGNLWYMGEDTTEYENGKPTTKAGSWEAGRHDAEAGVFLPGRPEVGMTYRQEYRAGEAEDQTKVLSLDEQVEVPQGFYRDVLMTKDYTPLQPEILEHKFYAKGVGPVLIVGVSGGSFREELVRFTNGSSSS
jgi:major membrane immunogen (membrane-anchored lipoprotein)